MEENLNGLIISMNCLLLSRSTSVRHNARKLMTSLMKELGPKNLGKVIKELRQTMIKGYQVFL